MGPWGIAALTAVGLFVCTVLRSGPAIEHGCVNVASHMRPVQLLSDGVVDSTFARVADQKGLNAKVKEARS